MFFRHCTKRSRRESLAITVIVAVSVLVVAEVGLRSYYRVTLGRWTAYDAAAAESRLLAPHPWLENFPRPKLDIEWKGRRIAVNSMGYRGPETTLAKPTGTMRVVCLGGSTTFDVKVSANDSAWPARLQALLDADGATLGRVEVINASNSGYALPQSIIDLALRTLDLQPDWVICMPGVNDLAYADRPSYQVGGGATVEAPRAEPTTWERLVAHSEVYRALHGRWQRMHQTAHGNWQGRSVERLDAPDPRGTAAFERNLRTLVGICRAHDIHLALVTIRPAYDESQSADEQRQRAESDLMTHPALSLAGHLRGYAALNQIIRDIADREGLMLLDAAQEFPADGELFADSVHFNDAGAARFAAYVAGQMEPRLAQSQLGSLVGHASSADASE